MTFLILVFGEITPKAFAILHAEQIALLVARPLELISILLSPLVSLLAWITKILIRLTGSPDHTALPLVTEEELKTLVALSAQGGELESKEKEIIQNPFQLHDITVADIMTPRKDIFCLPALTSLQEAIPKILKSGFSRVPLYEENKDHIISMVHVKDLLNNLTAGKPANSLKELGHGLIFVPKDKRLHEVFRDFHDKQSHLAIVVDEYGTTLGLITLEDLFEELVGEIIEGKDVNKQLIKRIDKQTILVDADTTLKQIKQFNNVQLPGKKYETISKILLRHLRKIPQQGEQVDFKEASAFIEEARQNKILKVRIVKKPEQNI